MLSRAPTREIVHLKKAKDCDPPKDLYYEITLKKKKKKKTKKKLNADDTEEDTEEEEEEDSDQEVDNNKIVYEPKAGDLIAFTDVRPKGIDDLNTPKRPYLIALVQGTGDDDSSRILSSKPILFDKSRRGNDKKSGKDFIVFLTNLTTNIRIWTALKSGERSMNLIKEGLQVNSAVRFTILLFVDRPFEFF